MKREEEQAPVDAWEQLRVAVIDFGATLRREVPPIDAMCRATESLVGWLTRRFPN